MLEGQQKKKVPSNWLINIKGKVPVNFSIVRLGSEYSGVEYGRIRPIIRNILISDAKY